MKSEQKINIIKGSERIDWNQSSYNKMYQRPIGLYDTTKASVLFTQDFTE